MLLFIFARHVLPPEAVDTAKIKHVSIEVQHVQKCEVLNIVICYICITYKIRIWRRAAILLHRSDKRKFITSFQANENDAPIVCPPGLIPLSYGRLSGGLE